MQLSKKAVELLRLLFDEKSALQLPVGCANEIVEIREFVKEASKEI